MGVPVRTCGRTDLCQLEPGSSKDSFCQFFSPLSGIMKSIIFLSLTLAAISAQSSPGAYRHNSAGDRGEAYVHDTTGDFGPYYYWKLRQQAKEQERSSQEPAASKKKVVSVRKLVKKQPPPPPQPQQSRFANFQPTAPARQPEVFQTRVRQPQSVVARQHARQQQQQQQQILQPQQPAAPAYQSDPRFTGLRLQFQISAPEFNYQNNFAENSYAFTSPLYATTAQGGSYSYSATY